MGKTRDNFKEIQDNMGSTLLLIKDKLTKERMDAFEKGFDEGFDMGYNEGYNQAREDLMKGNNIMKGVA